MFSFTSANAFMHTLDTL